MAKNGDFVLPLKCGEALEKAWFFVKNTVGGF